MSKIKMLHQFYITWGFDPDDVWTLFKPQNRDVSHLVIQHQTIIAKITDNYIRVDHDQPNNPDYFLCGPCELDKSKYLNPKRLVADIVAMPHDFGKMSLTYITDEQDKDLAYQLFEEKVKDFFQIQLSGLSDLMTSTVNRIP